MGLDGRSTGVISILLLSAEAAQAKPVLMQSNLLQANTSYFVLDCKGELLRDCGALLKKKGYEIRVVDLLNMSKSHCYNPFVYLQDDNDVQKW